MSPAETIPRLDSRFRGAAAAAAVLILVSASSRGADLGARIDEIGNTAVETRRVPAVSIAVARGDEILYAAGYGLADLENGIAATAETNYRIGSITKSFTALAIMQLVERNLIDLQDSVTDYLPAYQTHGATITVQHLLNHTSGIQNYTDIEADDRSIWRQHRNHAAMRSVFEGEDLLFEPGTGWFYTNSGYFLLGLIVEKVSGGTYAKFLEENVFEPAGLDNTQYGGQRKVVPRRARGYETTQDGWVNAEPISMTVPYAAGALRSSVVDLIRWRRALQSGVLLQSSTLERMTQVVPLDSGAGRHGYANGFYIGELDGHEKISHRGDINGFAGQLAYYPQDDLTIAVLCNFQGGAPDGIERQVARAALGIPEPLMQNHAFLAEEIERWKGSYYLGPMGIHLTAKDGRLYFSLDKWLPEPMPLAKQGPSELWLADDPDTRIRLPSSGSRAESLQLLFSDMKLVAARRD